MKAFLAAIVIMVVVAVGAAFALQQLDFSSASQHQSKSGSVRLD